VGKHIPPTRQRNLNMKIKIGLIGCGKISWEHVRAIEAIDDAEIVAACDISSENLAAVCEKTGAKGYSDYKELIKREDIDLALITLPHALHGEATCFAAQHGIHVFLEKPMGVSSQDCKRMIEACKKADVMLWIGHPYRFVPAYRYAKELIASGEFGNLVSISEIRNQNYFIPSRPQWFLKKEMSGGGIMMNLGAHSLDKMKFFTDSSVAEITGKVHIREGYDVEDSAVAFVKMENGVVGLINLIGHTAAITCMVSLYLTQGEIRIIGNTVRYCGVDGVFKEKECEPEKMLFQMSAVIEEMKTGGKKPAVTGEHGLDIVHAVKRLYGDEE